MSGEVPVKLFIALVTFTLVAALIATTTLVAADQLLEVGKVPNNPVRLNKENFDEAITDEVNPFWLLKFYAPW